MQKWARVVRMARKPSTSEFMSVCKTTFFGMIIVGGLGVVIFALSFYLPPFFADLVGI